MEHTRLLWLLHRVLAVTRRGDPGRRMTTFTGPTPEEIQDLLRGGVRTITAITLHPAQAALIDHAEGYYLCRVARAGSTVEIRIIE